MVRRALGWILGLFGVAALVVAMLIFALCDMIEE
jgi:hypothetical protein